MAPWRNGSEGFESCGRLPMSVIGKVEKSGVCVYWLNPRTSPGSWLFKVWILYICFINSHRLLLTNRRPENVGWLGPHEWDVPILLFCLRKLTAVYLKGQPETLFCLKISMHFPHWEGNILINSVNNTEGPGKSLVKKQGNALWDRNQLLWPSHWTCPVRRAGCLLGFCAYNSGAGAEQF